MYPRIAFALLLLPLVFAAHTAERIWVIEPGSRLAIYGSTNVNRFICRTGCYDGKDTLRFNADEEAREIRFVKNRMSVPVRSFDCGARPISKDFWETLQAERYPRLEIRLWSLHCNSIRDGSRVRGQVDISLAGVTKRFTIEYEIITQRGNIIRLKGRQPVQFSDFALKAPEKFNGLIKVKEILDVEFDLVIREL